MASLNLVDDIQKLLKDKWINDNSPKPEFVKNWQVKETGHVDDNYKKVLVQIDGENPMIYSLMQVDSDSTKFWDWLHQISITLDIRTGQSEKVCLEMANEIMRILKTNVFGTLGDHYYIQLLPGPVTVAHENYRNLWRILIDVEALRFNP